MATTKTPVRTTHYVVTLAGTTGRTSVWGLAEFRRLRTQGLIAEVHAVTPIRR